MSETLLLGILGGQDALFLVLIGWLHVRQSSHERYCTQWRQQFLVEHGKLLNIGEMVEKLLNRIIDRDGGR